MRLHVIAPARLRAVTHLDVDAAGIDQALAAIPRRVRVNRGLTRAIYQWPRGKRGGGGGAAGAGGATTGAAAGADTGVIGGGAALRRYASTASAGLGALPSGAGVGRAATSSSPSLTPPLSKSAAAPARAILGLGPGPVSLVRVAHHRVHAADLRAAHGRQATARAMPSTRIENASTSEPVADQPRQARLAVQRARLGAHALGRQRAP